MVRQHYGMVVSSLRKPVVMNHKGRKRNDRVAKAGTVQLLCTATSQLHRPEAPHVGGAGSRSPAAPVS